MEDAQRGCARVSLRPNLVDVMDRVTTNGLGIGKLVHLLGRMTTRLDCRLTEERAYADKRFHHFEDLLRQQNETFLLQSKVQLEATQHVQAQVVQVQQLVLQQQRQQETQQPAGAAPAQQQGSPTTGQNTLARVTTPALADALAPMEAALARLEAQLAPVVAACAREPAASPLAPAVLARVEAGLAPLKAKLARIEALVDAGPRPVLKPSTPTPPVSSHTTILKGEAAGGLEAPWPEEASRLEEAPWPEEVPAGLLCAATASAEEGSATAGQDLPGRPAAQAFFPIEIKKSKTARFLMPEEVTFFGVQREFFEHKYNVTAIPTKRKFLGLLLRYLDWKGSLNEPERKGCLACIVQSSHFQIISSMIIAGNTAWISWTAENPISIADRSQAAFAVDLFFLTTYVLEVGLKLAVHRLYFFVNADWRLNSFDFFLVLTGTVEEVGRVVLGSKLLNAETSLLRCMRILKLVKLLRVMRAIRAFDDVRMLLSSVIESSTSLMWSILLLALVYYLFGLVLRQSLAAYAAAEADEMDPLTKEGIDEHFGSVLTSMLSLFKATSGGNDWDVYFSIVMQTGAFNAMLFLLFMLFVQISLLNIITAVFLEKAVSLSEPDRMQQARKQLADERAMARELRHMCMAIDTDVSGTVSQDEFREHLKSNEMRCCFAVMGLDISNAEEFFEMLAFMSEGQNVNIEAFVEGCMQMRGGGKGITQQKMLMEVNMLRRGQEQFLHRLDGIQTKLSNLTGRV